MSLINTISLKVNQHLNSSDANRKENSRDYYQAASGWYEEKYECISLSRNRYRILAIGLGGLLGLTLVALITLLPLKQYVYRLVEVNQQTGEVASLKELEDGRYANNWIITRYFLNQYILNRHLYSYEDIKRTFNFALALSDKSVANEYMEQIVDTNPNSPINTLSNKFYRDVQVHSINQLNDNTALVRFSATVHNKSSSNDTKTENLQAVIKWDYRDKPASLKERDINPLGFFVTYYQESPVYVQN